MKPPNLVVLVLDSVRRDHLSCYGHARDTTPVIDRIADEAVVFGNAYAASCWTLPSHASLFTGRYPSRHRADFDTMSLADHNPTIAELLSARGYDTACISCNGFISSHTNLTKGFDTAIDVGRLAGGRTGFGPRLRRAVHRRWRNLTARDRGARRATLLARRWLAERSPDRPFFLFVNYMECHSPYRLRGEARYRFVRPDHRSRVNGIAQDPFGVMAGARSLSKSDLDGLRDLYDGCLSYLDQQVEALDSQLRAIRQVDRTALMVTSDHGESFGEHGLMDHQYGLYEHLIAVPLILRLPGREGRGTERTALAQHVDLLPTVGSWLGVSRVDSGGSAYSLVGDVKREVAVAEYLVPNLRAMARRFPEKDRGRFDVPLRAVRDQRFKLLEAKGGPSRLYDLKVDPGETRDLADDRPDIVADLRSRLEACVDGWLPLGSARQEAVGETDPMAEMRERLEALGYL